MNIEEVIDRLSIAVAVSKFKTKDYPNCIVMKQDLRTLLTAYEKEKEKNKEYEILLKRQEELDKEKENLIKQGWLNE